MRDGRRAEIAHEDEVRRWPRALEALEQHLHLLHHLPTHKQQTRQRNSSQVLLDDVSKNVKSECFSESYEGHSQLDIFTLTSVGHSHLG